MNGEDADEKSEKTVTPVPLGPREGMRGHRRNPVDAEVEGFRPPEVHPGAGPDEHLVSLLDRGSFAAEQYKVLRHLVEQNHEVTGLRIVAITSAAPGDGKTLTAINLAGALAQAPRTRVLLVDGDLRRPAVGERLGLDWHDEPGLGEVGEDAVWLQRVRYIPEFNLFVLLGGKGVAAPYEILSSPFLGSFFQTALRTFHYILIDTPPAVGFPDYRLLERWADGSLLVVGAHSTPRKMVELALQIVDPKKALGIVFNRADVRQISRYYDRYYRKRRPSP